MGEVNAVSVGQPGSPGKQSVGGVLLQQANVLRLVTVFGSWVVN